MRRSILYVSQILEWADAHHKRTGKWTTLSSGRIPRTDQETWVNIDQALRVGYRGLPGRWTLAQLLNDYGRKPHRGVPPPLTI